ncbi:hypothetical protein [Devosia nitrariae]|uniref:Uncharacterized protein n=1 Tax=Devosia nitrariae TaxID=2071872 RepID=A0ABQ5VZ88_9HYPH|nr:hypothetical protein [Devosia nitrariae]GLQ52816.1 hypothetical protein GCM10010862_00740 [Devosia nitrariae]
MSSTDGIPSAKPAYYLSAGAWAIAVLAMTAVHHAYGAALYQTAWRNHVLFLALPAALLILALLYIGWTRRRSRLGKLTTAAAAIVILIVPVAAIGVYEGGYNHLTKNIVFFLGGEARALAMFPPPTYEMPNDLAFELTGIAQFPLAVLAAAYTLRLLWVSRA